MLPEPSNPAQIELNRHHRQTSAAPVVNDGSFATIADFHSHGFFDAVLIEPFEILSGEKYYRTPQSTGFQRISPDNGGPKIMQSVFRSATRRRISEERDKLERRGGELKTGWTEPLHNTSAYGF